MLGVFLLGSALALLLLLGGDPALGAIHEYNDVVLPNDALMFRRSGMFATKSEKRPSFIKVDLKLAREAGGALTEELGGEALKVQLAIFDEALWKDGLGVFVKNPDSGLEEHIFCCTQELVQDKVCDEPFTLILSEDVKRGTYVYTVDLSQGEARIDETFPIPSKGLKYLMISSCNDMTGNVVINGRTEWKNPYGYLPGELFGFLPFFLSLAVCYMVLGLIWGAASFWHWRELMILQNYVTIVLALSMMEMTLRYYDFSQFNAHGTRSTGLMLWGSVLHTCKQTVSRLLVLVVSMGFGIVKPSLGDAAATVWALGGLFFFFSMVQRVYELSSHTSAITFMQYVTMLPVASLDLVFFLWIFRSLNEVILQLESKTGVGKENAKLALYRNFKRVLLFCMFIACAWSLVYSIIVISGRISQDWETRWVFDGFFDLLYLFVLVCIMVLWRPTNNATQFAYARVPTAAAADEEEYGSGLQEEAKKIVLAMTEPATIMLQVPEKEKESKD